MFYNVFAIASGIILMFLGLVIGYGDRLVDIGFFLVGLFLLCLGWFYKSKRQKSTISNEATEQ